MDIYTLSLDPDQYYELLHLATTTKKPIFTESLTAAIKKGKKETMPEVKTTIPFAELKNFNDSNSFVWTNLEYNPNDLPAIEKWLKEEKFLPEKASLKSMKLISGNVLGTEGRTDVLFETTEETTFHPIVRLQIEGLKWTSDFIPNYGKDYGVDAPTWPKNRLEDNDDSFDD